MTTCNLDCLVKVGARCSELRRPGLSGENSYMRPRSTRQKMPGLISGLTCFAERFFFQVILAKALTCELRTS